MLPPPSDIGGIRTTDFPRMEVERMLERSGSREIARIRKKIDVERAIMRAIIQIGGRIGGVIGGVLFPSDIGRSDIPGAIEEAKRNVLEKGSEALKRQALQKVISPVLPRIDPLPTRDLEEIKANAPARREPLPVGSTDATRQLERVRAPVRSRLPSVPTRTATQPRSRNRILTNILTGVAIGTSVRDALSPRPTTSGTPFIDPVFPPQNFPTPLPPGVAQPLPSPSPLRPGTIDDLCRANAQKQRKKRRKCDQRLNVVWAGGPNKGRVAGSKCYKFKE